MQSFKVDGMTCGHCERAVTAAIHGIDPRAAVQVDRAAGLVTTDSALPPAALAEAIRGKGYEVAG